MCESEWSLSIFYNLHPIVDVHKFASRHVAPSNSMVDVFRLKRQSSHVHSIISRTGSSIKRDQWRSQRRARLPPPNIQKCDVIAPLWILNTHGWKNFHVKPSISHYWQCKSTIIYMTLWHILSYPHKYFSWLRVWTVEHNKYMLWASRLRGNKLSITEFSYAYIYFSSIILVLSINFSKYNNYFLESKQNSCKLIITCTFAN